MFKLWFILFFVVFDVLLFGVGKIQYNTPYTRYWARIAYWSSILSVFFVACMLGTAVSNFSGQMIEGIASFVGADENDAAALGGYSFILGLIVVGVAMWTFYEDGLEEFAAKPPEGGVMKVWGVPVDVVFLPGKRFLPFKGMLFGFVKESLSIVDDDDNTAGYDNEVTYWTKDGVEATTRVRIFFKANTDEQLVTDAQGAEVVPLRNFINMGGAKEIEKQLGDIGARAVQTHMRAVPTWEAAVEMSDQMIVKITRAIAGESVIQRVPSSVPSDHLSKFYRFDKIPFTFEDFRIEELKRFGLTPESTDTKTLNEKARADIEQRISDDEAGEEGVQVRADGHVDYRSLLKERVECRYKMIEDLKQGRGSIRMDPNGIRITRVVVGEIDPDPEVLAAAKAKRIEMYQKESERIQMVHFKEDATDLATMPNYGGTGKQAFDQILLANNKMPAGGYQVIDVALAVNREGGELIDKLGGEPELRRRVEEFFTIRGGKK